MLVKEKKANVIVRELINLFMSGLFDQNFCTSIDFSRQYKDDYWTRTKNDDIVEEKHTLQDGGQIVKPKEHEGTEADKISKMT